MSNNPSAISRRLEDAQLKYMQYILNHYGDAGKNILDDKQKRLLPLYIEAHLLNQKFRDPDGEFHMIHRLVHEAAEKTQNRPTT
ncbi:MAG: hypothetical protein ACRENF_05810, partial [Thermodesulfobacteriota bacterium]